MQLWLSIFPAGHPLRIIFPVFAAAAAAALGRPCRAAIGPFCYWCGKQLVSVANNILLGTILPVNIILDEVLICTPPTCCR